MYFDKHQNLLNFLKVIGTFFGIWPLRPKTKWFYRYAHHFMWIFFTVGSGTTIPPLMVGIYYFRHDLVNMMKSLVEMTYLSEAFFNCIYCKMQRSRLLFLLSEIEEFETTASRSEKILRQKYVRPTVAPYTFMPIIFVIGALIFVFSPLVIQNRVVPLNTIYPMPFLDKYWARSIVYGLNNVSILVASMAIVVDLIVIMIFWYAAYKFGLINDQIKHIVNENQLRDCVILHQEAIRYVNETEKAVDLIVVKSIFAISTYIITCSLLVLNNVPLYELTQFFLITFLSCIRLYVCSWSAHIMTDTATNIGHSIYNSSWVDAPITMRKSVLIIIHRCQKPVTISAKGIIPQLSLRFCALVLYRTFSYFMTLRAILRV